MMDLSEQGMGLDWDTRILYLPGDGGQGKIMCSLIPTGTHDQRFCGGSRVLVATFTFAVEDSTTICIDTTWFPTGRPAFSRSDAVTYLPRDNMPHCAGIVLSEYGDANGDGVINISDVMYMVNYLYRSGPYPASFEAGDANCEYECKCSFHRSPRLGCTMANTDATATTFHGVKCACGAIRCDSATVGVGR